MPYVPKNRAGAAESTGESDASDITYSPIEISHWLNVDPGNVDGALDTLAATCRDIEDAIDGLVFSHSSLTGLTSGDDHTQYALLNSVLSARNVFTCSELEGTTLTVVTTANSDGTATGLKVLNNAGNATVFRTAELSGGTYYTFVNGTLSLPLTGTIQFAGDTAAASAGDGAITMSRPGTPAAGTLITSATTGFAGGNITTAASATAAGGAITLAAGTAAGGSLTMSDGGGSINTTGNGSIQFGVAANRITVVGTAGSNGKTITLANVTGTNIVAASTSTTDTQICMATTTAGGIAFNTMSGDITIGNTGVTAIGANKVTLAMMAQIATASILGRNTTLTGDVEVLSASTTKSLLSLNNVENTALSTWAGTTNIVTVGTITTGVWSGSTLAINKGGTGQTVANDSLNALLPSQSTHGGKYLQTDGSNTSWVAAGAGTVTSVSVTTANGVSGSVADSTTTPAITLTLGAITPTTVNGLTLASQLIGFTIAGGATSKTLTISNTLTLAGTDSSTLNIGTGGTLGTAAYTATSAYEVPLTFSTGLTRSTNTITVNTSQNIATLSNLTSNGFVKTSGGAGTLSVDTATYLTGNETITLSGDVSGTGTTAITTAIGANKVTLAMMAQIATASILGRNTASTGDVEVLSSSTTKTLLSLNNVENTALSTWAGTTNITTLGTIATGVWSGTVIADNKIASALTGKTYDGLTLTAAAIGFTIAGGVTSKTLTISNTLTLAGTDSSTLNIGTGGTLGSAAFTASSAYEVPLTFSTGLTRSTNTITVNTSQNIATLSNLTSNGFVKTSGGAGTLGIDTSTYLTGNETITLSGDVSGSGATSITTAIGANKVTLGMMAQIATDSFLGRDTASTGDVEVLSASTTKTILSLNNVENTALSTWAGTANIVTVGTIATGVWSGTTIAIDKGGTGQTTANAALNALLPTQTGNANKFLQTNATDSSWVSAVTAPAGSDTHIQFNDSSAFGGDAGFVFSKTTGNALTLAPAVRTTGSPVLFTITGSAHTTLTASTEATDVNFNLARTVQFSTGAITAQRAVRIQAPTYGFVGASTITTASTLSISGAPAAGTNATITNSYSLNVEGGKTLLVGTKGSVAGSVNAGFGFRTAGWDFTKANLTIFDGTDSMYFQGQEILTTSADFRFKCYNNNTQGGAFYFHVNSGGVNDPSMFVNLTGCGVGTTVPNRSFSGRWGSVGGIQLHTRQISATAGLCNIDMKFAASESSWTGNHAIGYVPNGTTSGTDDYWGKIHISCRNVASTAASVGTVANMATYAVLTIDNTSTLGAPNVGIATATATARLHLPAGAVGASRAPLKFTTGTNLTAVEAGTVEYTDPYLYFSGNTTVGRGRIKVEVEWTSASIGANQNDFAVPAGVTYVRLTSSGAYDITGFASGLAGRELMVINIGANALTLKHQNAGSAAANRFEGIGAADVVLAANAGCRMVYDLTSAYWRII